MSIIDAIRYRWRAAWKHDDLDRDVADELEHYAALGGHPVPGGQATYLREELRGMSRARRLIDQGARDLRFAIRLLHKSPTFTIVAAATLALGVGANATIFSIVDAVVLRPLPFPQPDRLVHLVATRNGVPVGSPSPLDVRDVARQSRSFQHVVAYDEWRKNVRTGDGRDAAPAEEMLVGLVSADYFNTLGVSPAIGRLFTDDEQQYGRHYVAAISRSLWRERYGGRADVLGKTIRVNDEPYTIIGVVPDLGLTWLNQRSLNARVWTPWARPPRPNEDASRGATGGDAIARLRPGVSVEQARSEIARIAARLAATYPADRPYGMLVLPLVESRLGALKPLLGILGAAVALVLLIACTNLSSLLFARNAARERELLVRTALGASRASLARQLLAETLVLAALGGTCGFALAIAGCAAVSRWHPPQFPQLTGLSVNATVMLFALAVALAAGVAFGLWPSWAMSRVDIAASLRAGGRTGTASREQRSLRSALVIVQIALALMLATATALLTQSVVHLRNQDLGFLPDRLLKAHLYIPPARYAGADAVGRFADDFGRSIRALPGIKNATVTTGYFPSAARWAQTVTIEGQPPARSDDKATTYFTNADDYFVRTYGVQLVRGRDFASTDAAGGPAVALVSASFVRQFIAHGDGIGARIELGNPITPVDQPRPITIVGVFRDVKNDGLNHPSYPQVVGLYRQLPEFTSEFKDVVVRTEGDPATAVNSIRKVLSKMDPNLPLAEVATMKSVVATAAGETTYAAILLGAFAVLGLTLAVIGTYGVVSYMVAQRTGEIGIRTALGASPADIVKLVVGRGIVLGLSGAALGVIGSAAAARLIAGQVYGMSAADPLTLGLTTTALVIVTALASVVPALRAVAIDPTRALRAD